MWMFYLDDLGAVNPRCNFCDRSNTVQLPEFGFGDEILVMVCATYWPVRTEFADARTFWVSQLTVAFLASGQLREVFFLL